MCPARWGVKSAPVSCAGFGTPPDGPPSQLLHAVGGVDHGDHPIVVSRMDAASAPNASPRVLLPGLVATAQFVVDYPVQPGSSDAPPGASRHLTGTSLAAAVASAAGALVWAYAPDRSADQVADALAASGAALPPSVDVSPFFGASPKRISIRCAVHAALGQACSPVERRTAPLYIPAEALLDHPDYDQAAHTWRPVAVTGSGDTVLLPLPDYEDWVRPQPDEGGCGSSCGKVQPPDFDILIPADYPGPTPVVAETLRLYDVDGNLLRIEGSPTSAVPIDLSPLPPLPPQVAATVQQAGFGPRALIAGSHLTGAPSVSLAPGQRPPALATLTYAVPVWADEARTHPAAGVWRAGTQTILYHP
jgi:hypothetical protein